MFKDRQCMVLISILLMVSSGECLADEQRIPSHSKALAHYMMGVMDDLNGESKQAAIEYQKSLTFDNQQSMAHLRLAAYHFRTGQVSEATKHVKIALKFSPSDPQSHYLLASIYSSQKKYDLATKEYEKVLNEVSQDKITSFEIHIYLAQLYYATGKYSQATDQLNQVLVYDPKNVSALFLLGSIALDQGYHDKAKEMFRKVLLLEADNDGALNSLAYVYAEENINLDEAKRMVEKAIIIDPTSGAYYDTLGWVLFKKGLYKEGLLALQKALNYVTDPVVYEHIGDVYQQMDDVVQAKTYWSKSLAINANQPKIIEKIKQLGKVSAKNQAVDVYSAK